MDLITLFGFTLWLLAVVGAFFTGHNAAMLQHHVAELEAMKRSAPWRSIRTLVLGGSISGQTMYSAKMDVKWWLEYFGPHMLGVPGDADGRDDSD